jgi:hypothetical protein
MPKRNKGLISVLLLCFLCIVAVISVFYNLNQPKISQAITTEPATLSETQVAYPAPRLSQAEQPAMSQRVYPPPSKEMILPTNTAPPLKKSAVATTKNNLPDDNVQRTSREDAKTAFDGKDAVFLDVRSTVSYNINHIPGAISIPEIEINERFHELDPNQWIITYCS